MENENEIRIDPETVISDCLKTLLGLETYTEIRDFVGKNNFRATPEFRKKFNGYYRVRQKSAAWYDRYCTLMEEQRRARRSLQEILTELYKVGKKVDVSFASKLIATVDPNEPIWDQYVLRNLGLEPEWEEARSRSAEDSIELAGEIYEKIKAWHAAFQRSETGQACLARFDAALRSDQDHLTAVKKTDYILWCRR